LTAQPDEGRLCREQVRFAPEGVRFEPQQMRFAPEQGRLVRWLRDFEFFAIPLHFLLGGGAPPALSKSLGRLHKTLGTGPAKNRERRP
jgi:hypothetical protein